MLGCVTGSPMACASMVPIVFDLTSGFTNCADIIFTVWPNFRVCAPATAIQHKPPFQ